jgi:RNA 2',3'-cyclic 3'-phosphodiesterase
MRLFTALALPLVVREHLLRIQQVLRQNTPRDHVRWTSPDQVHLTLKFLGEVEPSLVDGLINRLKEISPRHSPLELRTDVLGSFPHARSPRVIWVGLGGDLDQLRALQLDVESKCAGAGDNQEQRPFSPHLTLGRVRPGPPSQAAELGRSVLRIATPAAVGWCQDEFQLIRSYLDPQGARYEILARVPLAKPLPPN